MVKVNFSDAIITGNIDKEQTAQLALLKRLLYHGPGKACGILLSSWHITVIIVKFILSFLVLFHSQVISWINLYSL